MLHLNVNTDAVVALTNKLEKLHKSAFPVAIRTALNSAAFDMKKNTLLKTSAEAFEGREKNFFKANSRVERAIGFDVKTMHSTIGMMPIRITGQNNYSVKDLEKQEEGGTIMGRSFIPVDAGRVGGSYTRKATKIGRIGGINDIINSRLSKAKNKAGQFYSSAKKAGVGGYVLGNYINASKRGLSRSLYRIDSIGGVGRFKFRRVAVLIKSGVKVKQTNFAKKAALMSAKGMEEYYIKEAKKQIERLVK